MKKTRAFIFARGGSKGIPNKNLLKICNYPLFVHGILLAKRINRIEKIYVSTDSNEIADVALKNKVEVIKRPDFLATDHAPEWLAWQHAIDESIKRDGYFDIFLSLPPTAPLRNIEDVDKCLKALKSDVDIVLTITNSPRNPWFNMITIDSSGKAKLIGEGPSIQRRQDAPSCYDITTVAYAAKTQFIVKSAGIWDGRVSTVKIPPERSIDIDNPIDFDIARYLMEEHNLFNEKPLE